MLYIAAAGRIETVRYRKSALHSKGLGEIGLTDLFGKS